MAFLDKPDIERWVSRFRAVEEYQRVWRAEARTNELLYEQKWKMTGIPDNIPITIPSTARAIIDEATDHTDFDPMWIRIFTPTYGLDQDAEETAGRIRNFFPGWMRYNISHLNDVSPFRDYTKNMYIFGKAVYKVFYDKEEWPQLEVPEGTKEDAARKMGEMVERDREFVIPIPCRSIHPLALYEDPTLGQKRWAIEVYEHDAMEVTGLYTNWVPMRVKDDGSRMSVDEFLEQAPDERRVRIWDCYQIGREDDVDGIYHQVLIDETPAGEGEPTTPPLASSATGPAVFLPNEPFPYVIKFSGLGRQSGGKYEEKARGLLYGVQSLLHAEGRRLTQLDSIISSLAWPTLFVTGPRSRVRVEYGPNVVNYVPAGVQVETVSPQIPSGPIQSSLAVLQAGIERGTFGSVIRGDKPPQTTSAAQLAILSGQARLRFGAIKIHQEAALTESFQKVGRIIKDVIKEPITVWQVEDADQPEPSKLELKPSDLTDKLSLHIEIITDPIEERERRAQLAIFLLESGIIDVEEARERAGIRDTASMRRRVIRDKVLNESPMVLAALGEEYLLESGYDLESLALEKAMRDMLILRKQQEAQERIMGPTPGQVSQPGSAASGLTPAQLGGSPGAPTPSGAQQAGEASAGVSVSG